MKRTTVRASLALWLALALAAAATPQPTEEFETLNQARDRRAELVHFLKNSGKAREGTDGLLKAVTPGDRALELTLQQENDDRRRQFEILAQLEKRPIEAVIREFSRRMGAQEISSDTVRTLTFHGSNTIGASLAPELVRAWLEFRGAAQISQRREDGTTLFTYLDHARDTHWRTIQIVAHGSSTAFTSDETYPQTGLAGGFCDIGMASRPIKAGELAILAAAGKGRLDQASCEFPVAVDGVAIIRNPDIPVPSLTLAQITSIFCGETTSWKSLGGPARPIRIFARDDHSGTFDSFNEKVLRPAGKTLRSDAERFEDSAQLVSSVANDPNAIGFVGLAYVNSTVAQVAVKASASSRPLVATRLTIKTLDFPLSRLLYLYAPQTRSSAASEFLEFAMSDRGQAVVDATGLIGQGKPMAADVAEVDADKAALLADPAVPDDYKALIRHADRRDSMANVRFASGRTEPDVNSQANLQRLAGTLAGLDGNPLILCIGFTDSQGNQAANLKTSKDRAQAVRKYLATLGVTRCEAHGFGEAMPVADNGNAPGRAANRRVEIWIQR